jgi:hypothetical protein
VHELLRVVFGNTCEPTDGRFVGVINKGAGDYWDDKNALAVFLHAVKEMGKEAWEAIHSIWVGSDKVKGVNTKKLHQDFDDISFKSGECVDEFSMHISSSANQLGSLRDEIPDKKVVKKMLQLVPHHLE